MKKITQLVLLACLINNFAYSQNVWVNNGATVMNTSGVFVLVNGGIINQNSGTFDNSGEIILTGDWTNNAANTAFINSSPGKVVLNGATQNITGTSITNFFRLELSGTGVKNLVNIYTVIEDSLILNDREFSLDTNTAFVINPSTGIITRTTGFCSSLQNGGLARNTLSTLPYLFPVGSSLGTPRYRPVEITPNNASSNVYKVRMANVDASTEGFNIATRDTNTLCAVNNLFYHRIWQLNGTSAADITFYYDSLSDGYFNTSAHWQNIPQWEDMLTTTNTYAASPAFSTISKASWNGFTPYYAYALALNTPVVTLSTSPTPPTVCQNDTIVFHATPGLNNYNFYVNGTMVQSGPDSILAINSLTTNDSVYVIATDWRTCNAISNSITNIVVNPLPTITITSTPNDTVCTGDQVTLSGNGAVSYVWNNNVVDGVPFVVNATNTYTVTGTDANGCQDSAQIQIVVNTAPTLTVNAIPNDTICAGDTLTLSGAGASTYSWDNGVTNGVPFVPTATTTYTLTGTTSFGCSGTTQVTITVNPLPVVQIIASSDSVCLGDSTQLSSSGTAISYTWNNGVTTDPYYLTPSADSTVILTGTDANGCSNSTSITIKLLPKPNLTLSTNDTICSGQSVQLKSNGSNIVNIVWTPGTTLNDSTSLSPIATPTTTTTYTAIAGNGSCFAIDSMTVVVYPTPSVNAGNDTTISYGQSVNINAVSNGNSYAWLPSDFLSCTTCLTPTASPETTTEYILVVTNNNGCTNSDTITIFVDLECSDLFVPNIFTPNNDGDNDKLQVYNPLCVQYMEFLIFDRWGNIVYQSTTPTESWDGSYKGKQAENGVYVYVLKATLANGKNIIKKGNITLLK